MGAVSALGALGPAAGNYVDRLFSITTNDPTLPPEDDEGVRRAAEQAIAQAAASGNLAAIEFVEGRGVYREMRQGLDVILAWHRNQKEMHRRHEEERKCSKLEEAVEEERDSTALLTNDELAVLPPPSEEDTHLYKEAVRHGDFHNWVFFFSHPTWSGTFDGTPKAAESLPPGQTPALPAWVRGKLLKARQKREWAAMNSLFHIGQGAFKEELQRFPNGGSPVEIQARIEELVVIKAAFKAIKREAQARKENSCAVL